MNFVVKNGSKMRDSVSALMPQPGVGDLERHVAAGVELGREMRGGEVRAVRDVMPVVTRIVPASILDRFRRVQQQVHHHLPDLRRVGIHRRQIAGSSLATVTCSPIEREQHADRVAHDRAEIERLRLEAALPRVGEHLAAQLGGALGGALDLLECIDAG